MNGHRQTGPVGPFRANCRLMHRSNIALVVCKQTFVDIVYLFRGTMRRVIGLVAHERIDISERTLTLSDV
jgi:hypothetical protein